MIANYYYNINSTNKNLFLVLTTQVLGILLLQTAMVTTMAGGKCDGAGAGARLCGVVCVRCAEDNSFVLHVGGMP